MQLWRKVQRVVRSDVALTAALALLAGVLVCTSCRFSEDGVASEPAGPRPQFPDFGFMPDAGGDGSADSTADIGVAPDSSVDSAPLEAGSEAPPPADRDSDGVADVRDNCPDDSNADQKDGDKDGRGDVCDNCPALANIGQVDIDSDGIGDACDDDRDGDGIPNSVDWRPAVADDVLYYETVGNNLGDYFGYPAGSFSAGSVATQMCVTSTSATIRRVRLKQLAANDIVAQTRVHINSTSGSAASWPSVGVVVRARSVGVSNFDAYSCELDLINKRLTLIEWDNAGDSGVAASAKNSVTVGKTHTLRLEVKGSTLRCSVVGGPSITGQDSSFSAGTAGMMTFRAAACFDYLLVVRAP